MYDKFKCDFYGIDISKDTLKSANERNKKGISMKKIHLSIGNCCNMKYESDFFDTITSINTIYFWKDTSKGMSEIYRVLKKCGSFSNAFYSKEFLQGLKYTKEGFKYFDPEEIEALAKQVGFSKIIIKRISNGKGFIVDCIK